MHIALICGGRNAERGISLNSARSFLDHSAVFDIRLSIIYVNPQGAYYRLSPKELYSNTPSDFDFKLGTSAGELAELLEGVDLALPMIHGTFGEDGTLQDLLERLGIPFVGSSSAACRAVFDKLSAKALLRKHGFPTLPALPLPSPHIASFWAAHRLVRAVLKPARSGSSIGVVCVNSPKEAEQEAARLIREGFSSLLMEPYCTGKEFTLCVLQQGNPKPLIPLEIDIGERNGQLFDFRKKYLPTDQTRSHCPARFPKETLQAISDAAKRLFTLCDLRDFVRIDGWIMPSGDIFFSDFNPISGMEQQSLLFQQAAVYGMNHADAIEMILNSALDRARKPRLKRRQQPARTKQPVYALMGGASAERQVSVMSGTNVWLKLANHPKFSATPFLLDTAHRVWEVPYSFALRHSVEEIEELCLASGNTPLSLSELFARAKEQNAFLFLALHGGIGEDGTLQALLEQAEIPFNGSSAAASRLCMDKQETARIIEALADPDLLAMPQCAPQWEKAASLFGTSDLLVKPRADGCSAGVLRLSSAEELERYLDAARRKEPRIPAGTFRFQQGPLEMPSGEAEFLLEPFIETDKLSVCGTELRVREISGWCEMTIGILEAKGVYAALNPSITVALNHVLSVEEKFQGGTGINLTPPPPSLLSSAACERVKERACKAAKALGIQNYARLDLFVERKTGRIRVIEANSLPALTPSTVLFHQALSLSPPLFPTELLERIIEGGMARARAYRSAPTPGSLC